MKAEVTKSINVTKTNTLHQFDTVGIVGLESPVGKVPIIFYVRESCDRGRRGIVYYDDYDSVCFTFPEVEHADWMEQPYAMKYDAVETHSNDRETWFHRNHGILDLWVSVWREWYNGQIMYRPKLKITGSIDNNYPAPTAHTSTTTRIEKILKTEQKQNKINHSCGCRK